MRFFFLTIGVLSTGLGILGLFLPLVPTTPFLLLATYCFSKSHPRLHAWLIKHRLFGPPIRDWQENRVIRPHIKFFAVASMSIGIALVWAKLPGSYFAFKALTSGIMAGILVFILTRSSKPSRALP